MRSNDYEAEADGAHLTYEQIESYVDGRSDDVDREIVEGHAGVCPICAEELNDLTLWRERVVTGAAPAANTGGAAPAARRERWLAWWRRGRREPRQAAPGWGYAAPAGWAVAGIALAGAAVLGLRVQSLERETAGLARNRADLANELTRERETRLTAATPARPNLPPAEARPAEEVTSRRLAAELSRLTAENRRLRAATSARPSPRPPVPAIRAASIPDWEAVARAARLTAAAGDVVVADVRRLAATQSVLRAAGSGDHPARAGGADAESAAPLVLTAPVATRVSSDRPTFSWEPYPGASGYAVWVATAEDAVIATIKLPASATRWAPPAPNRMPRGKVLKWEVHALGEDGQEIASAAETRFEVLDARRAGVVARAARHLGADRLALATLYAQTGLLDDAERALRDAVRPEAGRMQAALRAARRLEPTEPRPAE